MSEPASISTGIAARYATAVFDLAKEDNGIDAVETDLDTLDAAIKDSADFRDLIGSPMYSREAQGRAVVALADKMGLGATMKNTLSLLAAKRRLFVLPQLLAELRAAIAAHKGELTAEVVSAKALTKTQSEKLSKTLADTFGKTVKINAAVDDALIGGLIVKVGSKMIDTSIRSKLNSLQNAMKEVG